jgi:DNA-binding LytR/AlgR family response regulator
LLLDDEFHALSYLKILCEEIPGLTVVKVFNDPDKLLAELPSLDFDLCITDIEMPGTDGIKVAAALQGKLVIFTTGYKEYATDAFDMDAVDYITKPVKKERLLRAVAKAREIWERSHSGQSVELNTDKGRSVLDFRKIIYIHTSVADSRDKEVLLDDGSTLHLKNINFDRLLEMLPATAFCRINKKEVVAMRAVRFFTHSQLTLHLPRENSRPVTLSVSETYRHAFLARVKS